MENKKFNSIIVLAGILNILGLLSIVLTAFNLTPITLIISLTFGGVLIGLALVLYLYVVIQDLKARKVL
ncbi:MAG TPA: hypothetical protein VNN20_03055 [Thermodesulfobacteriota bacterium]|nr:hypothetical protein [Thermodesulfobacteriota bacterium]